MTRDVLFEILQSVHLDRLYAKLPYYSVMRYLCNRMLQTSAAPSTTPKPSFQILEILVAITCMNNIPCYSRFIALTDAC